MQQKNSKPERQGGKPERQGGKKKPEHGNSQKQKQGSGLNNGQNDNKRNNIVEVDHLELNGPLFAPLQDKLEVILRHLTSIPNAAQ